MRAFLACLLVLVKSETFMSISRNYAIVEHKTTSPYVDDEVAVICSQNHANEYKTTIIELSSGSTFEHTSFNYGFIACSKINESFICVHRI